MSDACHVPAAIQPVQFIADKPNIETLRACFATLREQGVNRLIFPHMRISEWQESVAVKDLLDTTISWAARNFVRSPLFLHHFE